MSERANCICRAGMEIDHTGIEMEISFFPISLSPRPAETQRLLPFLDLNFDYPWNSLNFLGGYLPTYIFSDWEQKA